MGLRPAPLTAWTWNVNEAPFERFLMTSVVVVELKVAPAAGDPFFKTLT